MLTQQAHPHQSLRQADVFYTCPCICLCVEGVGGADVLPNIGEECEQEQQTGQDVSPANDAGHLKNTHTRILEITHVPDSSDE